MQKLKEAIEILPERLHCLLNEINPDIARDIQEIRIRAQKPLVLVVKEQVHLSHITVAYRFFFPGMP